MPIAITCCCGRGSGYAGPDRERALQLLPTVAGPTWARPRLSELPLTVVPYNGSAMIREVEAVYEKGVLRPLEPLSLAESQRVRITVSTDIASAHPLLDTQLIEEARAEVAAMKHLPTIEEVRAALSSIPGNMSEDVIAERGEY